MQTIYEAAGGWPAFLALARAWHRNVLADEVVAHAFSHGHHPQHDERIAAYWAEALGGPDEFSRVIGDQTDVLRLHAGNGVHVEMDERGTDCFARALVDAGLPAEVHATMLAFFRWQVAEQAHYPESPEQVADGLRVPKWGWDGPID